MASGVRMCGVGVCGVGSVAWGKRVWAAGSMASGVFSRSVPEMSQTALPTYMQVCLISVPHLRGKGVHT